jgi:hypothetical protein
MASPPACGFMDISVTFWLCTRENSRIRLLAIVLSPTSILLPSFFRVLAAIEDQIREYGFTTGHKSYPDGELWTEPSDPPEFRRIRRILSLRNECPVCQTMLVVFSVPSSPCVLSVDHIPPGLISRIFTSAISAADTDRIYSKAISARSQDSRILQDLVQICHYGRYRFRWPSEG